jgi:hypothetical protein
MSREIPLTKGYVALVDDEDYDLVIQHKWYAATVVRKNRTLVYASPTNQKKTSVRYMHQLLLPGVPLIDHIDGDGLNNCRTNIRPATVSQNAANQIAVPGSSRFKGVHWVSRERKWAAEIYAQGIRYSLKRHDSEEDAARAYDEAAIRFHGEFARLNFERSAA